MTASTLGEPWLYDWTNIRCKSTVPLGFGSKARNIRRFGLVITAYLQ